MYDFESLPFLISSQLEQSKRKSYTGKYSSLASEIAEVSACVYLHNLVLKTGPEIFNVCFFFLSIPTSNLSIQVTLQVEKGQAELEVKTTKLEIIKVLT